MANWSDPRPNASVFQTTGTVGTDAFDAGLRRYMLSVYNYMASAVLLTGIVAMAFFYSGAFIVLFTAAGQLSMFGWLVMLSPIGIVLAMSFGQGQFSTATLQLLFWSYAALIGLSLSTLFLAYTETSIAQAFFATAASFAGLSLYGYTTKRDLTAFGTFLIMGLVGLIVATLLNALVFQSGVMGLVVSILGVLIFAGLTAYHTQQTKSMYAYVAGTADEGRVTIMSALRLYLDFINMFLFILRIFGGSRN